MWLYPVLAHGIYDSVAMISNVTPEISGIITIVILLGCFWAIKWARKRMTLHLVADSFDIHRGIDEQ
jgi:hypothetical protein